MLPPCLFVGDVNYGEIEFPIYFNFFIKKAFTNPDLRGISSSLRISYVLCYVLLTDFDTMLVVMIGSEDQLERVRISFQESVFGPSAERIYVDDDISEKKRATGYKLDLVAEQNFLALKGTNPINS